ncbi:MAG: hypothetical protein WCP34_00505 [Pseudomonadota bacterium]
MKILILKILKNDFEHMACYGKIAQHAALWRYPPGTCSSQTNPQTTG